MKRKVKINEVKKNENNPRYIRDKNFKKLVNSIKGFPKMFEVRPIVVDENMVILGGNMRYEAAKEVGLKEVWIDSTEDWTEEEKKEFIVKDNIGYGEWDFDILTTDYNTDELIEWGVDIPDYTIEPLESELTEDFEENDYSIKITFKSPEDLQSAEIEIQELLDRKYKTAFFSVKGGVI